MHYQRSCSMFRVGDKVADKWGNHIWNITRVEGNKFWYDVIYYDVPNSPNESDMAGWNHFAPKYGWQLMEREQLPEDLFTI